MMSNLKPEKIKKLFILRPDHFGDLILFSGTFKHLRRHFPNAEITICVKKYVRNLLEPCPYIDQIVIWEDIINPLPPRTVEIKGKWRLDILFRWFKMKVNSGFNYRHRLLLFPLRNTTGEMHQIADFDRADHKIAILEEPQTKEGNHRALYDQIYSSYLHIPDHRSLDHELIINTEFLNYIGIDVTEEEIWPEVWTQKEDENWANENITRDDDEIIIGLSPGANYKSDRFYAAENYVQAFSGLNANKVKVIIFGSGSEQTQCSLVEKSLTESGLTVTVQNFAGKTTIRQLAESFKKCDLILSTETGALHMATALRKPTIGIVGGGHFGRFYPWGDANTNLTAFKAMDCFNCNWVCIYDTIRCIHEIKPTLIQKQINTLIAMLEQNVLQAPGK